MSEQQILTVKNSHVEECGSPPVLTLDDKRTCYFENAYGEQFIMQFERDGRCTLYSGDIGWEEPLAVEDFRGKVIVRFARSKEERTAEPKINQQVSCSAQAEPEEREQIRQIAYSAVRKLYGKPRLTDAECEYVLNCPIISPAEMDLIRAFSKMHKREPGDGTKNGPGQDQP